MKVLLSRKTFFALGLLLLTASLSGCGFKQGAGQSYKISLEIWGVFDDSDVYIKPIGDYIKINPHIRGIQYRKLSPETYKEDLLNAMASGKGPDIFMTRNSWRASFEDKTAPAPEGLVTEKEYRDFLVDVAAADFIGTGNRIYGIPLSVDSLALYYNKDLFNAAGISRPPETWDEVGEDIRKLTTLDQFGNITHSGIALGTGTNINRSSDILIALMMQFGVDLKGVRNSGVSLSGNSSTKALDYYTQFSRIGSLAYTWNARQHYSIDSFYEGTTAMMINYSWQYETLKQKNAKLNIGIARLPQLNKSTPANVANYWGYAVSKNRAFDKGGFSATNADTVVSAEKQNEVRVLEAWQFLEYLALSGGKKGISITNGLTGESKDFPLTNDPTKDYLEKTHKPAARRDLITTQQNDLLLEPFTYGNLIAKSWYQGDIEAAEGILVDMIENVVRGEKTTVDALSVAENRIDILKR